MFNVAMLGNCVAWRQTGNCDPDGPREQQNDKSCTAIIDDGWSGYCECSDGVKRMKKGCDAGGFATCNEACISGKLHKHNIVYVS